MTSKSLTAVLMDKYFLLGVSLPFAGWGWYVYQVVKEGKTAATKQGPPPSQAHWYLAIAIAGTVLGVIMAWLSARRVTGLLRDGLEIQGRIVNIGLSMGGWTRVDYAYQYQGCFHKKATSIPTAIAEDWHIGMRVIVLMDPRNPSQGQLKDDLLGGSGPDTSPTDAAHFIN